MKTWLENFKDATRKSRKKLNSKLMSIRIKNKDFTIISNDCWGGALYKDLGLENRTPFIGTLIFPSCYLKLLKNLPEYLNSPISWVEVSRYEEMNKQRLEKYFPIGLLKDDVEIHFIHESSQEKAEEKWNRRVKRINWNNFFIKFSVDENFSDQHILEEFESLNFPHKVCFTAKKYPQFKTTVFIKDYPNNAITLYDICRKYFDIPSWLNRKSGKLSALLKLINLLI